MPTPQETHPAGDAWRADSLARSAHSRLGGEASDPSAAAPGATDRQADAPTVCAEVCRQLLGDFSPALILLPPPERRRAQALAACTRALWDFATQPGTEGERLAAINRWEFALDAALAGEPEPSGRPAAARPPVHPVAEAMGALEPWPPAALEKLFALARRRAAGASADPAALAGALAEALTGTPPAERLRAACAGLLDPESGGLVSPVGGAGRAAIEDAPRVWRPALRFLLMAARVRASGARSGGAPAPLPALRRLLLLAQARWSRA